MTKSNKTMYWPTEMDATIVAYCATIAPDARNQIFEEKIYPALMKLSENIINTFNFDYIEVGYETIQKELVSHLTEKLHRFNINAGFKSFSFFSIVAKNYMILRNKTSYIGQKRHQQIETLSEEGNIIPHPELIQMIDFSYDQDTIEFINKLKDYWYKVSFVYGVIFEYCVLNKCLRGNPSQSQNNIEKEYVDIRNKRFSVNTIKPIINCRISMDKLLQHVINCSKIIYKYYIETDEMPPVTKKIKRISQKKEKRLEFLFRQNIEKIKETSRRTDEIRAKKIHAEGMLDLINDLRNI